MASYHDRRESAPHTCISTHAILFIYFTSLATVEHKYQSMLNMNQIILRALAKQFFSNIDLVGA